jgi:hypothetical protein
VAPTVPDVAQHGTGEKAIVTSSSSTRALIERLIRESGATDAEAAIRYHARALIDLYRSQFGELTLPLDMEVLASLRGITKSDLSPMHSDDAELVPDGRGAVEYRVNPDRPETRQRFSVAHEIAHTFFPDYQTKSWCRTDARYRRRDNPDEFVELLCDIGASELMMPLAEFTADVLAVDTVDKLLALAKTYHASPEAVLRRFAEVHPRQVAAVFLSWKLKPTQQATFGNLQQMNLFTLDPKQEAHRAKKLRIDYSIPSTSFRQARYFLPADKSVESIGPLYAASTSRVGASGECDLDLGQASGRYRVLAIPIWTEASDLGPNSENAVAAVIEPLQVARTVRKNWSQDNEPTLLDC